MSLRLEKRGFRVCSFGTLCAHATEVSAYVLNDTRRDFDGWGCGNHRPIGGLTSCKACQEHRK